MPDRLPLVFSTLGCPSWTLERAAQQAVADGYVGLEVRLLDGEIIPADLSAERRQEVRQIMAKYGIKIVGLGASTRFASPDPEERRRNEEELRRYVELANDLEVPMVRTFGGNPPADHTIDEAIDWVAGSLAAVAPTAEAQGVTVVLETHDAFCRGQEVARVLEQVNHPRIQAVWDVHHPYRMGESVEETWQYIGPWVAHVHIKDARRRPDGTWQLVLLGEGEVPCREVIQLLLAQGYTGYLSAEWEKKWHPEIEEPEIALPQHAAKLREWLG
ncbi:MAG: sugar phosphate isomerase/epimerase [Caldilineae bacterium]|nr:MAG: sugar phosphate isomerase/epimerase [Caldilineae bacterium]